MAIPALHDFRAKSSDFDVSERDAFVSETCSRNIDGIETFETQIFCEGETAVVFGNSYSTAQAVEASFSTAAGCDSTHSVSLIFTPEINTSEFLIFPQGTIANIFDIAFTPSPSTAEIIENTEGDTLTIFGIAVFENGILQDTFTSVLGCDSIHQITVVFNPDPCAGVTGLNTFESMNYCEGDTALVFGNPVTADGVFQEDYVTAAGCDSTHQVIVEFNELLFTNDTVVILEGDSVVVFGSWATSAGAFIAVNPSVSGCDSTHQITVEVTAVDPCAGLASGVIETFESLQFCENDSVEVFGNFVTASGIYEELFFSSEGCDSVHQIEVEFFATLNTNETKTFCEGDSLILFGNVFMENEILTSSSTSVAGCDSIHTIELVFLAVSNTSETIELCEGESVNVFGNLISQDGVLSQTSVSANGCDSIHEVTVLFSQEVEVYLTDTVCANQNIQFFDQVISETGTYFNSLTPLNGGCDSMFILDAVFRQEVLPMFIMDTTVFANTDFQVSGFSANPNYQYTWAPATAVSCVNCPNPIVNISESQTVSVVVTTDEGCSDNQQIQLRIDKSRNIFIPNVFSPNDDGENDQWLLFSDESVAQIDFLQIYDRWGNLVFARNNFQPNDPDFGWDGRFKRKRLNPGVFVYRVSILYQDGSNELRSGDLLLMR